MQTTTRDSKSKPETTQEINEEQRKALHLFCSSQKEEEILRSLDVSHSTYYRLLKQLRNIYGVRMNRELLICRERSNA
jgi:DNA invertase Pin-like site-specific DNA recombinase